MPAFADIQTRINQAVNSHLSDARADFGNGLEADVLYDGGYVEAQGMAAGYQPTILVLQSDIPGVKRGNFVKVKGIEYTVGDAQPDGTGMVLLVLEK